MPETIALRVNGREVRVPAGSSVAAALWIAGVAGSRTSVTGEPRAALCGMGVCFECRVTIDGRPHQLGCQTAAAGGMSVRTA